MAYTVVDGFPSGVDRSRPIYAAASGTLWNGINGHLTRGGDFEVRKAFVSTYTLPAGTFGLSKSGTSLLVFGSGVVTTPAGVTYQRLQHPDGLAMTKLLSADLYRGKAYTIAEFSDGSIHHFYDGALVTDWSDGVVRAGMTDNTGIAAHLAALIDASDAYSASSSSNIVTIDAAVAGTPYTIASFVENVAGGIDNQAINLALVTSNVPGVAEVQATGSFRISAGTLSAGVNKVSTIKVNGIDILGAAVDWATSNSATASAVADQINLYASTPNYTATVSGSTVTIVADAGTGASVNGYVVASTVGGDVVVDSHANLARGVTAVAGVAQRYTATVIGTFEVGDRYGITLGGVKFGAEANPGTVARIARTHSRKIYAGGSLLHFTGVDTPTGWNRDTYAGAGFLDPGAHESDAQEVTALGQYLNYIAVGFENSVHIWYVDADDSLNSLSQIIGEIGTRSPKAMKNFGTLDLFFLAQTGVRSIRSRAQVNIAGVNDVGTPVDEVVQAQLSALTDDEVRDCCSVVDPQDGRYWLAVGDKIFVFSYFPSKKVSGWTWYEPGRSFTDFAVVNRKIHCRAGDVVYVYGGADGATYEACEVECRLPFYSFGRPGHRKGLVGIDLSAQGEWDVDIFVNPQQPDADYVRVGIVDGITYTLEDIAALADSTHFSVRLKRSASGAAKVSGICTYYLAGSAEG